MKIKIISFNHKLNKEIKQLLDHYKKQIRQLEMLEYKPILSDVKETNFVLSQLVEGDFFICLTEMGNKYNSVDFANYLAKISMTYKRIVFLIGKAEGINKDLLSKANSRLSLSDFTFPHEFAKLLLVEQIYRANQILNNHPYHK